MATNITRRSMLKQTCGIALGGAVAAATGFTVKDAMAQRPTLGGLDVTGVANGETFEGVISGLTATLDRTSGVIDIAGSLTGVLEDAISFVASITADNLAGTDCDVLNLDLGELDLDVLGLVVVLAPISLDVTAEPGPGNLLGNLVCAIAGLLDRGGPLQALTNLLNNLFAAIG